MPLYLDELFVHLADLERARHVTAVDPQQLRLVDQQQRALGPGLDEGGGDRLLAAATHMDIRSERPALQHGKADPVENLSISPGLPHKYGMNYDKRGLLLIYLAPKTEQS